MTDLARQPKNLQSNIRQCLSRLAKEGTIKKVRRGIYRRPTDNKDASRIDFLNASTTPVEVRWPLELEEIVRLYPKNLVVVGGFPNAGKTAFLLDFARLNMNRFNIKYLSSEMGPEELKVRLEGFQKQYGIALETWADQVEFRMLLQLSRRAIHRAMLDLIDPDGVTIIDYLEIHDDFHKVAGPLRQIFDPLDGGVALIGLQKDPDVKWNRGKSFSLEKPRYPYPWIMTRAKGFTTCVEAEGQGKQRNQPP